MSLTHTVAKPVPARPRHGHRPIALVYGTCQAEALRQILVTHPAFAQRYHLPRIPSAHDITPPVLARLDSLLPKVEVLITQEIEPDYRGMALGTEQLVARLPASATVMRFPVAYFEGTFPFQVYIDRDSPRGATCFPLTNSHDVRTLYAASRGWDVGTTLRRLDELRLDPQWVRDNAERSLKEFSSREIGLEAQLTPFIRQHPTTSFHTVNHPANGLVTETARQLLSHLGYQDADLVLGSRQTYLDCVIMPLEPQIVRALGGEPDADMSGELLTSAGTFSRAEVISAYLALYADNPDLLANGLRQHAERLHTLESMWGQPCT
jgi:hypothetical protein